VGVVQQTFISKLRGHQWKWERQTIEAVAIMLDMLDTYFGHTQKDYWRAFFGGQPPQTPLTDVAAWTGYFRDLLGRVPESQSLSAEEVALKQKLYAAAPRGTSAEMAVLMSQYRMPRYSSAWLCRQARPLIRRA
jgi:hypothetical protein